MPDTLFTWKQGDTEPLDVILHSEHLPTWTLTGDVVMNMKRQGAGNANVITRGECTITDPATHEVRFRPTAAQTNQTPGTYQVEFENTDDQTIIRTFPNGEGDSPDYFLVEISKELG